MGGLRAIGCAILACGLIACGVQDKLTPASAADKRFEVFTVKDPQQSAAFLAVDDVDGDGISEIILTTLLELTIPGPPGPYSRGAVRLFRTQGGLEGPWEENVLIATTDPEGYPFINTPQVMDVDEDGIKDIIVQTGFLSTLGGAQFWLKGPDFSSSNYFAPETTRFLTGYFWHEVAQIDLDGDGLLDIVTTSVQTQDLVNNPGNPLGSPDGNEKMRVEWHRHLGDGEFAYQILAEGIGGVFIKAHDVDADGDQDLLLTQFFGPPAEPSIVWMENQQAPALDNDYVGLWETHTVDSTIGLGYHMEIIDLNHDGKLDLVVDSHSHQDDERLRLEDGSIIMPGIYRFDFPADPASVDQWPKHVISQDFRVTLAGSPQSQGVPGIFDVGDLNGDGLLDLAVPGDGNAELYAFLQRNDGSFERIVIEDDKKMIAMAVVADVDGDGREEIVAAQHNSNDGGTELPPGFLKIYRYIGD